MSFLKSSLPGLLAVALGLGAAAFTAKPAQAQSDPFIGQMMLVPYSFCPRDWANADGQLLAISQYSALFSLMGTTYGGDGRTTFGLPDLRGRVPLHVGTGAGLSTVVQGQKSGRERVTLTVNEMPSHNHLVNANNGENGFGDRKGPANDFLGSPNVNDPNSPEEDLYIYADQDPNVQMDPRMITHNGGSQPVNIRNPYLGMRWCIALQGIYPSRN